MKTAEHTPADYIEPLIINGLHGRVLHMPAQRKKYAGREILMIYGLHSSIERMFGIVQNVADFGDVTMPDLPGFGGMDSFYRVGQAANVDTMADYLATFIKLRYKKRRFSIVAMSYGFSVVTRMLDKYPAIAKQVDLCVSLAGLTDKNEFIVPKKTYYIWSTIAWLFDGKIRAGVFRYVFLQSIFIKTIYLLQARSHPKMKGADKTELKKRVNFEVYLWHANDARTYVHVTRELLHLAIPLGAIINVPVLHISIDSDQYIGHKLVEAHLKQRYEKVITATAHMPNHAPTVISSKTEAAMFIPKKARTMLEKLPKKA